MKFIKIIMLLAALVAMGHASAQSSSLYLSSDQSALAAERYGGIQRPANAAANRLNPAIAQMALTSVSMPEPRRFTQNDLVTIIIRESHTARMDAELETERGLDIGGDITEFPRLNISDLLDLTVRPNDDLSSSPIRLDVGFDSEYESGGQFDRRDEMSGRLTARVLDVRPNGTLVLEARKHVAADGESQTVVLTGTCRVEDVAVDNTILSTQLYDLHVVQNSEGEVRRSSRKGILTRVLEGIFNF
jgi:flagellar L-ring protein precursor FlgH